MASLSNDELEALLAQLLIAKPHPLGFATAKDFPETRGGVYSFTTPDDKRVVYIGKGTNLRNRLHWHANERSGGVQDFVVKLQYSRQEEQFRDLPADARAYLVRYVVVNDEAQCDDFETFAIRTLQPPLNKAKLPTASRAREPSQTVEGDIVELKFTVEYGDRKADYVPDAEKPKGTLDEVWFDNMVYWSFEMLQYGASKTPRMYLATKNTPAFMVEAWDRQAKEWVIGKAIDVPRGRAGRDTLILEVPTADKDVYRHVEVNLFEIKDARHATSVTTGSEDERDNPDGPRGDSQDSGEMLGEGRRTP